jgi:hypothetical protein
MSTRITALLSTLLAGIVLGNLLVATSTMYHAFAPIRTSTAVLIVAGIATGFLLGWIIDDKSRALTAVVVAVTLGMLLFFAAVLIGNWFAGLKSFLDVVMLLALLQSAGLSVLLLLFGALGVLGAFMVVGYWSDR